jgi:hypothetical protein
VLAGREHTPPGAVPHDIGELRLLRAARRRMGASRARRSP